MWAERAGVPVCSRYVQAYVDLLSSIRYSMVSDSHLLLEDKISMDAATPLPMEGQTKSEKCGNSSVSISHKSWEWDEGWISCDAGWEVWTGSIECMAVDWTAPSRSAVRSLMDGGEGPPMLREGCFVVRGLDWDDENSGTLTGKEDGKDKYEKEKKERERQQNESQESANEISKKQLTEDKVKPDSIDSVGSRRFWHRSKA